MRLQSLLLLIISATVPFALAADLEAQTFVGVRNEGAWSQINQQLSDTAPGSLAHKEAEDRAFVQQIKDQEDEVAEREANRRENDRFFREQASESTTPSRKLSRKEQAELEKRQAELEVIAGAGAAAKAGRYQEALSKIAEVPGGDRDLGILRFKARCHLFLGQYDLEAADYTRLLEIAKEFHSPEATAEALILRARAWQRAGKFDLAEADLQEALKKGNAYLAHVELVELNLNMGRWQQAIDEINIVMKHFSDSGRYAKRGFAYFQLGDQEKAKADLEQAIAGKTRYAPGWLAHASLMARMGQAQTALDDCDYIIKTLDPQDPWAHVLKGNVYLTTLKQPARAVEEYDAALKINPQLKQVAGLRAQAAAQAK